MAFQPYAARLQGDANPEHIANVYCIGRNYAEHARELGNEIPTEPVVFLKTTSALRHLDAGDVAFPDETFHHEAELVLLIGSPVALGATAGWEAVRALALGLDLTRREVQNICKAKGLPWTPAKSFAGSGLLSDFLPLKRFPTPDHITFSLTVNGESRQQGDTRDMLTKVPGILTYIARSAPLLPGDLVFTGTPRASARCAAATASS